VAGLSLDQIDTIGELTVGGAVAAVAIRLLIQNIRNLLEASA
jgi:hypothetical protein